MKEEFVSYSQAVALKECGFDWECDHYYTPENTTNGYQWFTLGEKQNYNEHGLTLTTSAPTQALAQKWLREVHKISVEPICNIVGQWDVNVCTIGVCGEILWSKIGLDSYESALSAGLNAALELIKQK